MKTEENDIVKKLFEVRPGFRQLQIGLFLGILAIALFVGIFAAAPYVFRFGQIAFGALVLVVEWIVARPFWVWICLSILLAALWITRAIEKNAK